MNLKQLSEILGLSQTTVSRALSGYPEVRLETRRRVEQAAKEHNYRPHNLAKSLATGRAMAIGHVVTISAHKMISPIFADFIAGAGEVYSKAGYHMVLDMVSEEDEEACYRELAAKRSVDGIIVHGPRVPETRIKLLKDIGLPFIMHGRAPGEEESYAWMDVDNKRAFLRATNFLLDLGHTRIALINGFEDMNFAVRRREGYEQALHDHGLLADLNIMHSDELTEPFGYNTTTEMLKAPNPPTAILVSSVISAMGARRAIRDLNMVVGKDVSIITHDDELTFLQNSGKVPMFTCTRSSIRLAGKRNAEMLLDIIANPDTALQHDLWEAQLTVGESTGPAPSKA